MTPTSKNYSRAQKRYLKNIWKPHAYQESGVEWLVSRRHAGLFLDPGLGKTSISLASITILMEHKQIRRVLVVAPMRVCYLVWPQEIEKWSDFSHLRVSILHGPKKAEALAKDADIYLINPEGLGWLAQVDGFKKLGADLLIIDESTKFKHPSSQRHKTLMRNRHIFSWCWILTGSPTANALMDLFGQLLICDAGRALGRYITHFRRQFFEPSGYKNYEWTPKPTAQSDIRERISDTVMHMSAEDYLKLPDIIATNINVQLPDKARKTYDQVEATMFSEIDEMRAITAVSAAAVSIKCRQIASGTVYLTHMPDENGFIDPRKEYQVVHSEKLDALEDLLEERGGRPTLVLYYFGHELQELKKRFGKNVPVLGGGTSSKKSEEICEKWNRGELPLLLGHPASMGHGLNLQEGDGDAVVWYSLTWDQEAYDQTIKRLHRQGSKHSKIYVYHLIARNTVDELMYATINRKTNDQKSFLQTLKNYIASRRIR